MLGLSKNDFSLNSRISLLFLAGIFFLAVFLRFFQLGDIPNGLQQDETSIGYNAYSVLLTGKDEYGKHLPVLFKAFGEYKLPGYIYLSVLPIALFGPDAFAVRFASAFFGSLTVIVMFFFVRELMDRKNNAVPLLATLFLAVNPWHLHFSRGAFEVTPALFFIVMGVYLFFLAKRKKSLLILLGGLFIGGLSMYTYNIARFFTPFLFLSLFLIYRPNGFIKNNKSRVALGLFLLAFFGLFLLHILEDGGYSSTRGTLIFSSAEVQSRLLEFRSYFVTLPGLFTKLFFNSFVSTGLLYLQNVLSYFSVSFLFISGSPHGNHGIGSAGQLYLIEAFFLVIGVVHCIRAREKSSMTLFVWAALVILIAAMTREAPQATRGFFLIIPLVIFSAIGCIRLCVYLLNSKNTLIRYGGFVFVVSLFMLNMLYYFSSYYVRFPVFYAKQWRSVDQDLVRYLRENHSRDPIIVDNKTDFLYTSLLYYLPYPPSEFQQTVSRLPDDTEGFSKVLSFGRFVYKDIDWEKDTFAPGTLVVTSQSVGRDDLSVAKEFFYPERPVVLAKGQDILQFPVRDSAYVILEAQ